MDTEFFGFDLNSDVIKYEESISDPALPSNPFFDDYLDFGSELFNFMDIDTSIVLRSEQPMDLNLGQEFSAEDKSLVTEFQPNKEILSQVDGCLIEFECLSTKQNPIPPKNSLDELFMSSMSYPEPITENKIKRKRKAHPTKNFLANFRRSHLNAIYDVYGKDFTHPAIQKIIGKPGMNMNDYQNLYNVEEFRSIFADFFKNRQIYRDLMSSRVCLTLKKVYLGKLHVFEKAFKSRKFHHIN